MTGEQMLRASGWERDEVTGNWRHDDGRELVRTAAGWRLISYTPRGKRIDKAAGRTLGAAISQPGILTAEAMR